MESPPFTRITPPMSTRPKDTPGRLQSPFCPVILLTGSNLAVSYSEGLPMSTAPVPTLLAVLQRLTDPRCRRGVRHPFAAVLALTFLGMLCRQTDFATIARWAKAHWTALKP